MKTLSHIIFCLLLLSACTVSRLDRYPGKALTEFPENVTGEYRLAATGLKGIFKTAELDSFRIRILKDRIQSLNEKGWQTEFRIGKDEVLSQEGDYYFVSRQDVIEPKYWNTSIIQVRNKDLLIHPIAAKDKSLVKDPLKNYLELKLLVRKNKQSTVMPVDPKDDALIKNLSEIPDDSKDSVLYYQMNEEQLLKYISKELSNKNGVRFVRINPSNKK